MHHSRPRICLLTHLSLFALMGLSTSMASPMDRDGIFLLVRLESNCNNAPQTIPSNTTNEEADIFIDSSHSESSSAESDSNSDGESDSGNESDSSSADGSDSSDESDSVDEENLTTFIPEERLRGLRNHPWGVECLEYYHDWLIKLRELSNRDRNVRYVRFKITQTLSLPLRDQFLALLQVYELLAVAESEILGLDMEMYDDSLLRLSDIDREFAALLHALLEQLNPEHPRFIDVQRRQNDFVHYLTVLAVRLPLALEILQDLYRSLNQLEQVASIQSLINSLECCSDSENTDSTSSSSSEDESESYSEESSSESE